MTAGLKPLQAGQEYWHKVWGRVLLLASHPHDGATLVIERRETTSRDDDDHVLDSCESSDLEDLELQDQWPWLGFTSAERSKAVGDAWGAKHGFYEVISGRWVYAATGLPVPQEVWAKAWDEDYLQTQKEVA